MGDTNTTFKGKKINFDYENPRFLNKNDNGIYVKNANPNHPTLGDKIYKVSNIEEKSGCLTNDDICLNITLIDENSVEKTVTDNDLFYVEEKKWFGLFGGRKTRRQKRKNRRTKKNNRKSRR